MDENSSHGKSLGEISLECDAFDLDLKVNEGYQSYGSELLRLSLLATAGLAAVWLRIYLPDKQVQHPNIGVAINLIASFIFLTSSAAAAVIFKFSAADSLAYQLTALRRRKRNRPEQGDRPSDLSLAKKQEHIRDKLFGRCTKLLSSSILCLVAGVLCFGFALVFLMKS